MIRLTAYLIFALALIGAASTSAVYAGDSPDSAQPPLPAPAGPPAADDTLTVLGLRPLETLRFVNPTIDGLDAADNKEAWLHVQVKVSETGRVTEAKIIDAFPKNSYEKAIMKVASGWRFQPLALDSTFKDGDTFHVGVAIYSDLFEDQRVDSPRAGTKRTVSRYNFTTLDNLIKDLTGTMDVNAAGARLEKLRQRYEAGDMTVTDIARYYAAMARYERLRNHYNVSLAAAQGALMLSRFLDNRNMIYALHLEVMSSLLSMGRNDDALDYYDRWRLVTKIPMSKDGQQTMENLRAEGVGKRHPYTIVDFDAAHRYERKHTAPKTEHVCIGIDLPGGPPRVCGDWPLPVLQTSVELISFDFPNVLDPGPLAKPVANTTDAPTETAVQ